MKNSTIALIVVSLVDLISDILFIVYLVNILNHSQGEPKGYQDLVYGSCVVAIFFLSFSFLYHFILYRLSKEKTSLDLTFKLAKGTRFTFPECILQYIGALLFVIVSPFLIFFYLLKSLIVGLQKLEEEQKESKNTPLCVLLEVSMIMGWGIGFRLIHR